MEKMKYAKELVKVAKSLIDFSEPLSVYTKAMLNGTDFEGGEFTEEDGVWDNGCIFKWTFNGGTWHMGVWDKTAIWKGGYDGSGNWHELGDSPDKWGFFFADETQTVDTGDIGEYENFTGQILLSDFTCKVKKGDFIIRKGGDIEFLRGAYYDGSVEGKKITSDDATLIFCNFRFKDCVLTNCNCWYCDLDDCTLENSASNEHCTQYYNCDFINCINNGAYLVECIWENSRFNKGVFCDGFWLNGNSWYGGDWYGGYTGLGEYIGFDSSPIYWG